MIRVYGYTTREISLLPREEEGEHNRVCRMRNHAVDQA